MPVQYLRYAFLAMVVVVFWRLLARRRLFAAATVQVVGYPLYAYYLIPLMRGGLSITLGQGFAAALFVEAVCQGVFRRARIKGRGSTFVKLTIWLFLVRVLSYIRCGAEDYSDPVGHVTNSFVSVVLPVCIIALAVSAEERMQIWRAALWTSGIASAAYLALGLPAMMSGLSGQELRTLGVLQYGLGGGAALSLVFFIFAAYLPVGRRRASSVSALAPAAASVACPALILMSGTRGLILLLPLIVALVVAVRPGRGTWTRSGLLSRMWLAVPVGALLLLAVPGLTTKLGEAYDFMAARFRGEYDAEGGSGRTEMYARGWQLFLDYPILGAGEGNSGILTTTYLEAEDRALTFRVAQHSLPLKVLAEQGLIGAAFLLAITWTLFWNVRRCLSRPRADVGDVSLAFAGSVLGITGFAASIMAGDVLFFAGAAMTAACAQAAHGGTALDHIPRYVQALRRR